MNLLKKHGNRANEKGFTIVELLIVIVVIAILAAIVIVAYNGIQNRAKTTRAQTNANAVQKIAESYNADNNVYPSTIAQFTAGLTAHLPATLTVVSGNASPWGLSSTNGATAISYRYKGTIPNVTGGVIRYWDFTTNNLSTQILYVGDAVSGDTFNQAL